MKSDFLNECLTDLTAKVKRSIPIDSFNAEYCAYCQNKECSRSGAKTQIFVTRVMNWESSLFINVPRAHENDPKYESIRGKWFRPPVINVQNSPPEVIQEKPKETAFQPPVPHQTPEVPREESEAEETIKETQEEATELNGDTASEELTHGVPPEPATSPIANPRFNTNWDQDEYIEEKKDEDVIISPGGSFTFGG